MPRKSLQHLECAVANTVEMVNDAWTVLILRDAFLGVRRFDQFVDDLGIARNVLTDRLERLVADGMMETRLYQERPPRHEYRLTEQGKDLFDLLMTLWSYGERWKPPTGRRQKVIHSTCSHAAIAFRHPLRALSRLASLGLPHRLRAASSIAAKRPEAAS